MMVIPHRELSPEALQAVLEEFVTRDGTDYGDAEIPLPSKVAQVRQQLDLGLSVIVFDEDSSSVTLIPSNQAKREGLLEP